MTRDQERAVWSKALAAYGAQKLEQMICGHLELLLRDEQFDAQPGLVSAEGMAQLIGILLANIVSRERPLLGSYRTMNRLHFRVLRQVKRRLGFLLLSDLPIDLVPAGLLRPRAQLDHGV